MLKIENLHAQIEDLKILNGISLTVNPGEIHAILGPNGSGKSTLGRVILGDDSVSQTEGSITFNGTLFDEEVEIADRAKAGFFLTFQSPPELDGVNVKDFLFAAKKSLDPDFKSSFRFKKNLKQTLEDIRLGAEFVDREVNKGFSGGERKKIEVASLLALNPCCAFLDEIDSGVDIDTIRQIGKSLKTFLENKDKSIILVTHSEKLLQELPPTHVHIFVKGKIVKSGGPELIKEAHDLGFDQHN